MPVTLYNTMERKLEEFIPIEDRQVRLYCCGPTVYNYAHVGNLRTYVFEDILRRTLEYYGYSVRHVMNVTDVGHLVGDGDDGEDKMEKTSKETGKSVYEIADFYADAFFADTADLNILTPTVACRATEHIDDMIALVKRLEERGHTYTAGGNVYFSIDTFPPTADWHGWISKSFAAVRGSKSIPTNGIRRISSSGSPGPSSATRV